MISWINQVNGRGWNYFIPAKLRAHDDLVDFAWMPDTRELCAGRPFVVRGAWKAEFDLGNILA